MGVAVAGTPPSWPRSFAPQHHTRAAGERTAVLVAEGDGGDAAEGGRPPESGRRSWTPSFRARAAPESLAPQQLSAPGMHRAGVRHAGADQGHRRRGAPPRPPGWGCRSRPPVRPSWPWSLAPQHLSPPPAMAQVCCAPAATAVTRQHPSRSGGSPGCTRRLQRCADAGRHAVRRRVDCRTAQVDPQLPPLPRHTGFAAEVRPGVGESTGDARSSVRRGRGGPRPSGPPGCRRSRPSRPPLQPARTTSRPSRGRGRTGQNPWRTTRLSVAAGRTRGRVVEGEELCPGRWHRVRGGSGPPAPRPARARPKVKTPEENVRRSASFWRGVAVAERGTALDEERAGVEGKERGDVPGEVLVVVEQPLVIHRAWQRRRARGGCPPGPHSCRAPRIAAGATPPLESPTAVRPPPAKRRVGLGPPLARASS